MVRYGTEPRRRGAGVGGLDDLSVTRRSSLSLPSTQHRPPHTGEPRSTPTSAVYAPPTDPRDPNASKPTDPRALAAAFLLVAVIPLGLFVASRPLVGVAGLVTVVCLLVGARRVAGPVRRLRDGRDLQIDLPGGVRLRVARHPAECAREERASEV